MKKVFIFSVTIMLSFFLAEPGHALMKKLGQSTMNFLVVGVSPRAGAMGNAYTAVGKGAESMFFNPAGVAEHSADISAFVGMTQWIADINYTAAAISKRFGSWGTVGVSFLSVDYGAIEGTQVLTATDPKGYIETGDIENVGAYAFGLTYARQLNQKFSMGGQLMYVGQQLGQTQLYGDEWSNNNAHRMTLNFGASFYPGFRSFRFGMAMRNFTSSVKYQEIHSELPMIFMFGVSMDLMDIVNPDHSQDFGFLFTTEFTHPNSYAEQVNVGGEFKLVNLIFLRGGYQFNYDLAGLTAGIGVAPTLGDGRVIYIDYSYSTYGDFDPVNRLALRVSF